MIVFVYDITDYHRLKCLGEDAESLLKMLLDNIQAGVCLFVLEEHVRALYLNDAYFDCIGWDKDEYASRQEDIFSTLLSTV